MLKTPSVQTEPKEIYFYLVSQNATALLDDGCFSDETFKVLHTCGSFVVVDLLTLDNLSEQALMSWIKTHYVPMNNSWFFEKLYSSVLPIKDDIRVKMSLISELHSLVFIN